MGISPFSKSQKRHIRREKARIRREVLDTATRQELIVKLYEKVAPRREEPKKKLQKISSKKTELVQAVKEK